MDLTLVSQTQVFVRVDRGFQLDSMEFDGIIWDYIQLDVVLYEIT